MNNPAIQLAHAAPESANAIRSRRWIKLADSIANGNAASRIKQATPAQKYAVRPHSHECGAATKANSTSATQLAAPIASTRERGFACDAFVTVEFKRCSSWLQ